MLTSAEPPRLPSLGAPFSAEPPGFPAEGLLTAVAAGLYPDSTLLFFQLSQRLDFVACSCSIVG